MRLRDEARAQRAVHVAMGGACLTEHRRAERHLVDSRPNYRTLRGRWPRAHGFYHPRLMLHATVKAERTVAHVVHGGVGSRARSTELVGATPAADRYGPASEG